MNYENLSAAEVRRKIRAGAITGPTAGMARHCAQANLVILPAELAADFEEFCRRNPRPCPLLGKTATGSPHVTELAADADLRTDVPRYRVFHHGVRDQVEPTNIVDLWRDDFIGFLLGCSFTFERALTDAGLPIRHLELGRNVSMYTTSIQCQRAGAFSGPLVVSMRPFAPQDVAAVREISGRFASMHGAPLHVGDPGEIGIADLSQPDFGDAVPIAAGEVPVFWACGVTPQAAVMQARPEICITHSPGCMFICDRGDESFRSDAETA